MFKYIVLQYYLQYQVQFSSGAQNWQVIYSEDIPPDVINHLSDIHLLQFPSLLFGFICFQACSVRDV